MKLQQQSAHKIPVIEVLSIIMYLEWSASGRIFSMKRDYSATVLDDAVDFVKFAEAMGAEGIACDNKEEFKEAFKKHWHLTSGCN